MRGEESGCLVLTRKVGDAVYINLPDGRRIEVRYTEDRGDQIRLAFLAPRDIQIIREELTR